MLTTYVHLLVPGAVRLSEYCSVRHHSGALNQSSGDGRIAHSHADEGHHIWCHEGEQVHVVVVSQVLVAQSAKDLTLVTRVPKTHQEKHVSLYYDYFLLF